MDPMMSTLSMSRSSNDLRHANRCERTEMLTRFGLGHAGP